MNANQTNLIQQLHNGLTEAISRGWSINRIAQEAQIKARSSLQSWYSGAQKSIDLETAAKLADWLGMRLTAPKIPKIPKIPKSEADPSRKPKAKTAKPKGRRSKSKR